MGRKLTRVTVAAVACLSLAAEPAAAHVFNESTTLSAERALGRRRALIFGVLSDGQCKRGKTVQLVNARTGGVKATDVTDREGEYRFKVRRGKRTKRFFVRFQGTVETSYGHSHTCGASQSRIVKIRRRRNR